MTREEWDALSEDEKFQYVQLMERSDNELRSMLRLIPECHLHGDQCIPHACEWIQDMISKSEILEHQ